MSNYEELQAKLERLMILKETKDMLEHNISVVKTSLLKEMEEVGLYDLNCKYGKAMIMDYDKKLLNKDKTEKALKDARVKDVTIEECKREIHCKYLMAKRDDDAIIPTIGDVD